MHLYLIKKNSIVDVPVGSDYASVSVFIEVSHNRKIEVEIFYMETFE